MTFAELDILGVYIAPISPILIGAWFVVIVLRRIADHFCLLHQVWHPALFQFAVYIIILSSWVLFIP